MAEIVVAAESRTETGKNVNRRLRVQNRIPAVVYGAGKKAEPVSVSPKEIATILRSTAGENTLIDLEIAGARRKVILKDYQLEPLKGRLIHADFYEVAMDKPLQLPIHVELLGTPIGVKLGGQLDFVTRTVEVECLPADIPEKLSLDISGVEMGKHLRVSDLTAPAKVRILADPELVVVHVQAPRAEVAETPAAVAAPAVAEPEVAAKKGGKPEEGGDKKPAAADKKEKK